jgi:cation diffusion facilitator family transporter
MPDQYLERSREEQRVTLIGTALDMSLGIAKVIVGIVSHSHALIVDGIHSFSDVATDLVIVLIARYSNVAPDTEHPYGHARFETMGTLLLGSFLIALAGALVYDSFLRLLNDDPQLLPEWPALIVAALSIFSKEWIYRYTNAAGQRLRSDMLIANAWHSRSDALSSIVVFIGIGGGIMGMPWLDIVAAIFVAGIIAKVGWDFAWRSVMELVDTGLSAEQTHTISDCALSIAGVSGVHGLRSRRMGPNALLDIHIQVDRNISVSEGHQIGNWVSKRLRERFEQISDVTVHIDVEYDLSAERDGDETALLPLRQDVIKTLQENWRGVSFANRIRRMNLHYLDARIKVEVFMPAALLKQANYDSTAFRRALQASTGHLEWLDTISVWYGD